MADEQDFEQVFKNLAVELKCRFALSLDQEERQFAHPGIQSEWTGVLAIFAAKQISSLIGVEFSLEEIKSFAENVDKAAQDIFWIQTGCLLISSSEFAIGIERRLSAAIQVLAPLDREILDEVLRGGNHVQLERVATIFSCSLDQAQARLSESLGRIRDVFSGDSELDDWLN